VLLFVNKKKQKNFLTWAGGARTPRRRINKSFLVLFYKKEPLPFLLLFPKEISNG
jgi:hypothetical protein